MVLVPLLVACAPAPEDTGPAAVEAEPPPPPVLTAEEALAAIGTGTQHGLPDVIDAWNTYMGLMALGDDRCPGPGDQLIDSQLPLTGCTADSGVTYAGVSMVLTEDDLGAAGTARLIGGDFTITDTAGHTLDFGGQVMWQINESGGNTQVYSQVKGTLAYPGGSPWFAAGVSAVLDVTLARPGGGEAALRIEGGLGTEGVDLWFDLERDPSTCALPTGTVDVRDASGAWWTYTVGEGCDGCGTLAYPGRPDADACVDLGSIADAAVPMLETRP